ncbi:MAG: AbrB/MazE/SpoVT family DNA-binding domain-containing protein [Anaerolineae bacterium]|nr:AbrB/MazE/SpoVT family DNA-binding domain-containing protein [Anaerolineae bacterium]
MHTKIQKWGNSLAIRIPKSLADETGLQTDSDVEICVIDGQLHIIPIQEPRYNLNRLLEGITPDNLHGEIDTGGEVGKEVW